MPRAHIIRALLLTHTSPTELYTLSLHDALPIWVHQTTTNGNGLAYGYIVIGKLFTGGFAGTVDRGAVLTDYKNLQFAIRSEEHTSELQSRPHLVCRLLLEKKKTKATTHII